NNAERPDLILLDINLPRVDGIEVLNYIKTNRQFKTIPVAMLTTSTSEKDVIESYNNHANCYISKPVDLDKFFVVVQQIEHFWNSIVHLPKNG
ncbi:MAG: response regulator, partial [Ferruginibacter sp.]